jgi:hypothetical protein
MLKNTLFLSLFSSLILASCSPLTFYQLYNIDSVKDDVTKIEEQYFFEDENCTISYEFWEKGGAVSFVFYNKSDNTIEIHLNESSFILNDFANDYYQNMVYTRTTGRSASSSRSKGASILFSGDDLYQSIQARQYGLVNSASLGTSVEYSVSFQEDSIIRIPPKSAKRISEFSINETYFLECDLETYPKISLPSTVKYSQSDSPFSFRNRMVYSKDGQKFVVDNAFYVSEITNYATNDFFEFGYPVYCEKETSSKKRYFKYQDSNKFYVRYLKPR